VQKHFLREGSIALAGAALIVGCLVWPVLSGGRIYLRDVGTTHRPAWAAFEQLGFARMNPAASFGQPYRGNPNFLLFYPFPKSAASVEWHVVLHLLLLATGMFVWLRRSVIAPEAAFFGAAAFTLSGYVVSASSSLNTLTTIAWMPWLFFGATVDDDRARVRIGVLRVALLALFSVSGEPVLIAAALLLAIALAWRSGGSGAVLRFAVAGAVAFLLTLPVHRDTLDSAADSFRVVRGFDFRQATVYSLHPARLLELFVPGLFGSPGRILAGAWWGHTISHGVRPYIYSTFLGVTLLALAASYGINTRFRRDRGWWLLLFATVVLATGGYLPGTEWLWNHLPALHVARFPIKLFLFTTLAAAVLGARAFDRFAALPAASEERRRTAMAVGASVFVAGGAAVVAAGLQPRILEALVSLWWNPHWRSDPVTVVPSSVTLIVSRLFADAALLTLLFFWLARKRGRAFHAVVIVALVVDLTAAHRDLVSTVEPRLVDRPSPIVAAALARGGRVFERAAKDLDAPVFGQSGKYPEDDTRYLAVAQARQAWALQGSMAGLRYAYDRDPDGSYTWRNYLVQELLEAAPWSRRVKWLHAAGVRSVIASDVQEPLPGLRPLLHDDAVGVPVTLYAVEPPLPELRAITAIRWVPDPQRAIAAFERDDFDEQREVVAEGTASAALPGREASVRLVSEAADRLVFDSDAPSPAFAFLARSYTRKVRATAAGVPLPLFPANVHLCLIALPVGRHRITVTF
jgi:hypothetical protein